MPKKPEVPEVDDTLKKYIAEAKCFHDSKIFQEGEELLTTEVLEAPVWRLVE